MRPNDWRPTTVCGPAATCVESCHQCGRTQRPSLATLRRGPIRPRPASLIAPPGRLAGSSACGGSLRLSRRGARSIARPLAIAALEDKIVQGAAALVLNAVYEEDFHGSIRSGPTQWPRWRRSHAAKSGSRLSDRRSRRASIASGGRKRRKGRETAQEPRQELDSRAEAPSADTVAITTASLRSDRNFVRLVRVAKRRLEGAAAQKSLWVRRRRAIQIGRAT